MSAEIIVSELSARQRPALERHFLALGAEDRRLRFGIPLGDTALRTYVQRIDFGARTLFMHCLRENGAMMHLARKQGMALASEAGEVDAHLLLAPADAATHFGELFAQRVALFDHALKAQLLQARRIAGALATRGTASPARER